MWNSICSPEMELKCTSDLEPYAYVAYVDGEKETVPLKFIYQFPPKWREQGWNRKYLYKVFWSPREDDSPSAMLKREPEIPVYEKGSNRDVAGYHRASVELVKDSLKELEEELESGKRLSIGLPQYKFTSFDQGKSKTQVLTADKKRQRQKVSAVSSKINNKGKPIILKHKKPTADAKKKGKATIHDSKEIDALRSSIHKRFPGLECSDGEVGEEIAATPCPVKSRDAITSGNKSINCGDKTKEIKVKSEDSTDVASTSDDDTQDSDENQCSDNIKSVNNIEIKKPDLDSDALSHVKGTPHSSISQTGSRSSSRSTRRKIFCETSSSDEVNVMKKIKLDPDFTPRKYVEAKEEILIQKKTIQRVSDLNLRHQEKILKLESEREQLETRICELQSAFDNFKAKCKCRQTQTTLCLSPVKSSGMQLINKGLTKSRVAFSEDTDLNFGSNLNLSQKNDQQFRAKSTEISDSCSSKPQLSLSSSKAQVKTSSEDADTDFNFGSDSNLFQKKEPQRANYTETSDSDIIPQNFCEVSMMSDKDPENHSDNSDERTKVESLWAGVSPSLKEMVLKIPSGQKKDIKFIKELCIVTFGPEVLAASSILGTKKGSKSKGDEEKKAKPALDKEKLEAIRGLIMERVIKEEKITRKEAEEHDRCSKKRMYEALRDAQKWCRDKGYGVGVLENCVNENLFAAKKSK